MAADSETSSHPSTPPADPSTGTFVLIGRELKILSPTNVSRVPTTKKMFIALVQLKFSFYYVSFFLVQIGQTKTIEV